MPLNSRFRLSTTPKVLLPLFAIIEHDKAVGISQMIIRPRARVRNYVSQTASGIGRSESSLLGTLALSFNIFDLAQSGPLSTRRLRTIMSQVVQALGTGLGATIAGLAIWLYTDYRAWIAFGTGGTAPNISGYMKITKFRILRAWSGDDLKDPTPLSAEGHSYLQINLPKRSGKAPKIVSRTLPQRQIPGNLDPVSYQRLHNLPKKYAGICKETLDLGKSITEGLTTDAIYGKPDRTCGAHDKVLGNEIAHVHPQDNSLHVWLTQADAKKVISAGWGERFPLASLGMVDPGWTFLYAPRNMDEVTVTEEIVKAAIGHLTGKTL